MIGERHVIEAPKQAQENPEENIPMDGGFGEDEAMTDEIGQGFEDMEEMPMDTQETPESTGNPELDSLIELLHNAGPKQLKQIANYAEGIVDIEAPTMQEEPKEGMDNENGETEEVMPQ